MIQSLKIYMTEDQKSFISSKAVIPDCEADFQTWMKFLSRLNFLAKWHEVLKQMRVLRDLVKDSIIIEPVLDCPIAIHIEDRFSGVTVKTSPRGFQFFSEVFYGSEMVDYTWSRTFKEALRIHKKMIKEHKHHLRVFKMKRVTSNIFRN